MPHIKIATDRLVLLGLGKYVRADAIMALEPIDEKRGPGNRTRVLIDHPDAEIIAGRTEHSIVRDMSVQEPMNPLEVMPYIEILEEIVEGIMSVPESLRVVTNETTSFDMNAVLNRIETALNVIYPIHYRDSAIDEDDLP